MFASLPDCPGNDDGADARQLGAGAQPGHGRLQRPQPHAEPGVLAGVYGADLGLVLPAPPRLPGAGVFVTSLVRMFLVFLAVDVMLTLPVVRSR